MELFSEKYDEVDQPEDDLVLVLDQDTEDDSVLPIENITQAPVTYDTRCTVFFIFLTSMGVMGGEYGVSILRKNVCNSL